MNLRTTRCYYFGGGERKVTKPVDLLVVTFEQKLVCFEQLLLLNIMY